MSTQPPDEWRRIQIGELLEAGDLFHWTGDRFIASLSAYSSYVGTPHTRGQVSIYRMRTKTPKGNQRVYNKIN